MLSTIKTVKAEHEKAHENMAAVTRFLGSSYHTLGGHLNFSPDKGQYTVRDIDDMMDQVEKARAEIVRRQGYAKKNENAEYETAIDHANRLLGNLHEMKRLLVQLPKEIADGATMLRTEVLKQTGATPAVKNAVSCPAGYDALLRKAM